MPRKAVIQFMLRIEPALHSRLERAAKKSSNSLNREMVNRLAASFASAAVINLDKVATDIEQATSKLTAIIETLRPQVPVNGDQSRENSLLIREVRLLMQMQQNLINAAEVLIEEHSVENIERVRQSIAMIIEHVGKLGVSVADHKEEEKKASSG